MMREGAPDEVLAGAAGYWSVVSSWLGGRYLGDVPLLPGSRLVSSREQELPDRLTLRVPRYDGRDWLPTDNEPEHPLAENGQELSVSVIVWSAVRNVEYETRCGRYLIVDSDYDDAAGEVTVLAESLLRRVQDDKLTSPLAPRVGGTFKSEARRLLPLGMSASFDPELVDRPCPPTMEWAEDRLAALYEIADAWPARLSTDQWGQVQFLRPLPDEVVPAVTLKDGARGTVLSVNRSRTRANRFNRIVVRSSAPGVEEVQAISDETTGPRRTTGPYGAVTKIWASPLVKNAGEALAAAHSMRRETLRPARIIPVTAVPDPRIALDTPVEVLRDGFQDWGWVWGVDLPLTVEDGPMRVDVAVSA